jgi:glycerate dehydrogenase
MKAQPLAIVLDGYSMDPGDLDWSPLGKLVALQRYDRTPPDQVIERARHAEILIINKIVLGTQEMDQLPQLKCVCITATGYDNVDLQAAKEREIAVFNVSGYSTESVAQHVFALLFALTNRVEGHHRSVQKGEWSAKGDFSYTLHAVPEVAGKTLGIVGYGKIGKRVAAIGHAFGMNVLASRRSTAPAEEAFVKILPLEELLQQSDVISLHTPLTQQTRGLINSERLATMKKSAYLINTGRGALIEEPDLREALRSGEIAGAALDVLTQEPPPSDHPLLDAANCLLTPHMAWASFEARKRLLAGTTENVRAYLESNSRNRLV